MPLPRFACVGLLALWFSSVPRLRAENPIITDTPTADPTALVHDGRVYLYTGNDEAPPKVQSYRMNKWLCFSSSDMVHWEAHGSPLSLKDFDWVKSDAWAGDVIEKDGKSYDFVPMRPKEGTGYSIGVAVADQPTGPFKDARGSALVTDDMTTATKITWDDIDPKAFIDTDAQAYLFWGNTKCYCVKLKPNLTELDGPIQIRRSVCVDYLYYNPDGTIKRVVQTTEGTSLPPQPSGAR